MTRNSQTPYGDAIIINTPNIDHAVNALYQQDQERQRNLQAESRQTDQLLGREIANARSVDMGEILDKYDKYKKIQKELLFNKKLQHNTRDYIALQSQANAAKAETMQTIGESAAAKKQAEQYANARNVKPNLFRKDFGGAMQAYMTTPLSKLKNHPQYGDLTNPDTFRTTEPTTNFTPILKGAQGSPQSVDLTEETPDKLGTTVKTYKRGNDPYTFYNNLVGGIAGSQAPEDLVDKFGNKTPEEEQAIEDRFNELSKDPHFQKIYGLKGNESFPANADSSPAAHTAKIMAMEYAILNTPTEPSMIKNIPNAGAVMDARAAHQKMRDEYQFKNRVLLQKYAQHNAEARIALHHDYKVADEETRDSIAEAALDSIDQSGKPTDGGRQVNLPQVVSGHIFGAPDKQHPQPDQVVKLSNGDYQARYFKVDDKGATVMKDGKPELAESLTKTIPASVVRLGIKEDLAKGMQTKPKPKAAPATKAPLEDLRKKYGY